MALELKVVVFQIDELCGFETGSVIGWPAPNRVGASPQGPAAPNRPNWLRQLPEKPAMRTGVKRSE